MAPSQPAGAPYSARELRTRHPEKRASRSEGGPPRGRAPRTRNPGPMRLLGTRPLSGPAPLTGLARKRAWLRPRARPARDPGRRPSCRCRVETRLAPPPERGRAPPASPLGLSPASYAGSLLVKRNGFILVVSVLAAVGGTGLYHPSGPQLPHFCRPSRQLRLLPVSPRSALTPSLLL